jgi:hypothetical protein
MRYQNHMMFAIALFLAASPLHAAREPVVLKPSSKWEIDYKADSCRLARIFGEGDQEVILMLDRYQPGDPFRVTLVGKQFKTINEAQELQIKFGAAEQGQSVSFYRGNYGKDYPALIVNSSMRIAPADENERVEAKNKEYKPKPDLPPIGAAREAAVEAVMVGKPLRSPIILETGSMRPAFGALEKCTEELLTHWGIDVAKHANLKSPVTPLDNPGNWLNSDDYPKDMLIKKARSLVYFRLNIDETGKPTACNIQQSTQEIAFDKAVCAGIMKRARFEPALASDGTPIPSYYINTVRFAIR